jgi:DNA-binding PadR family transcriptional regulator
MSASEAMPGPRRGHGGHFGPGPAGWLGMTAGYGRGRGRGRDRGHGAGPGLGFGPGFGPGGRGGFPFGGFPGPGSRRGPRVRRGDVRSGILALLAEEPRNGYQIIQELAERSGGVWRASPGSVYPALQQLEDEGLVRADARDGRRQYHLTDAGREYVAARAGEHAAPWEAVADSVHDDMIELRDVFLQVGVAFGQVVHAGSAAQVAEARRVLADTRRALYRILAEGDAGEDEPQADEPEEGGERGERGEGG